MTHEPIFRGAATALVTPLTEQGIDYPQLGRLIDWQIDEGIDALVICGTTGESATLSVREHIRLVKACVRRGNGRARVIAGAGSNDTAAALRLSRHAQDAGADALLLVTPYYNKATQDGLIQHYTTIADRVEVPILLYNVPSRTGVSFTAETYRVLSQHPNINGVKEASGNFSLLSHTRALCGPDFHVWSGNDDQVVPMMALGAKGVISVASNIIPGVMREMTQCLYDYEQGLNQRLLPGIRQNQFQRASLQRKIEGLESKLKHKPNREEELELQSLQDELENLPEQKPVRFFADDCTSEALTNLLCANHGIFSVISTEGGIFDVMAGRYSNRVNIDTWLKAHCGDVIQVDRLTRGTEYIARPALSAILTVQPSVLHEIMDNATLAGRGLVARFLYASPPSRIGARVFCAPPVPLALQQQYREAVFRFMALPIPAEPAVLVLSDRATAEIASYFSIHEQFLAGEGQEIADWASKYIGAILRIAGLLHAADMDDGALEIQAETVRRAIAIGEYFLAHSRYAYSVMGVDETIRKARVVVSKLQAEKAGTWKRNELFKLCRGKFFKKVEDILPTLELLESYGYLRQVEPELRGSPGRRPDVIVQVNPACFS